MRCDRLLVVAVSVAMGATAARAQVLVPDGLQPGDKYHLIFVTDGKLDAVSADIGDYNAFVQTEAERAGAITEEFAIDWFAIGSTDAVSAKDNAIVEGPVYLLDGLTQVADGFVSIWNEPLDAPIDIDQFGRVQLGQVITSTVSAWDPDPTLNGTAGVRSPLGGVFCPLGGACTLTSNIGDATFSDFPGHNDTNKTQGHMYALSPKLTVPPQLLPGDADQNLRCDQLDFVQVLQRGKYLTGQPATWGDGDWNGAPGGYPGNPPQGNGLFDQLDIISVLGDGCPYLTGPYAAISPGGVEGDEQTSIIYDARTGEIAVDAPAGRELMSINIDSLGIFTGVPPPCWGSFCDDADNNLFRASFGFSFGSRSFGNVAQAGLSEAFVANDLTVVGSLSGGGDLGDGPYLPEPSTLLLALTGILGLLHWRRVRT